jgi:hypothetical protein
MKQRWLPGFDGPELEEPAGQESDAAGAPVTEGDAFPSPVLPGRFALFTAERELLGLLEAALLDGRFEEALDLRNTLSAREGASRDTRELVLLDQLGLSAFWAQPVATCIDRWLERESRWDARPAVRAEVRDGVLRRLVRAHGAAAVVRARPSLLPAIVNFLGKGLFDEEHAGALLRDALAAGLIAPSGDFDDPRFVDLLAENRSPAWLASIGALNRWWPVPGLSVDELGLALPAVPQENDDERGAQFWLCMRTTVSYARDSAAAGEARKQMRLLDAELHGQFMRQGVARE